MTQQPKTIRVMGAAAVAAMLGLLSAPSFAGNYAEGDPRPQATTSSTTRAAVASDAQQWLKLAPTQGYSDGISQRAEVVSTHTRAAVAADTRLWLQSGLAARQNGEAGADVTQPGYREAAAKYMSGQSAAQAEARVQVQAERRTAGN
jgi:hypothetical protein